MKKITTIKLELLLTSLLILLVGLLPAVSAAFTATQTFAPAARQAGLSPSQATAAVNDVATLTVKAYPQHPTSPTVVNLNKFLSFVVEGNFGSELSITTNSFTVAGTPATEGWTITENTVDAIARTFHVKAVAPAPTAQDATVHVPSAATNILTIAATASQAAPSSSTITLTLVKIMAGATNGIGDFAHPATITISAASCTNECPVQGQLQCATATTYQSCEATVDADSCLEWSNAFPCGGDLQCSNGVCTSLCNNDGNPDPDETCANCAGDFVSQTETCNGLDDDCDGNIDEGFNLQNDASNCGACGNACAGDQTCQSGSCVGVQTIGQQIDAGLTAEEETATTWTAHLISRIAAILKSIFEA